MSAVSPRAALVVEIVAMIMEHEPEQAGQWVMLEDLCLVVGKFHGWSTKQIAVYVETMAERLAEGARGQ
jgi:hypothetical protein